MASGPEEALKDKYHRPKEPTITESAKMLVVNIASTKPKDHNYAAELWTQNLLAKYIKTPKSRTITVSVDEKPSVQAIKNIAPDLQPIQGKSPIKLKFLLNF